MKHLPDDWQELLAHLEFPVTLKVVAKALDIKEDRIWIIRKGDKVFDDAIVSVVKQTRPIYTGSRIPKERKPKPLQEKRAPSKRSFKTGINLPLIDKENLQQEMKVACLVIASLTKPDMHEITLNEMRRWGALLALAHDTIDEKREEIIKLKREMADLRVQMHRLVTPKQARPHSSANGVSDVV